MCSWFCYLSFIVHLPDTIYMIVHVWSHQQWYRHEYHVKTLRLTEHWTKDIEKNACIHPKRKQEHAQFWKIVSCCWITIFFFFRSILIGNTFRILPKKIATFHHLVMILWGHQSLLMHLAIDWSVFDRYPQDCCLGVL